MSSLNSGISLKMKEKKGTTIFPTTHNVTDADLLCDRVAFIANGERTSD